MEKASKKSQLEKIKDSLNQFFGFQKPSTPPPELPEALPESIEEVNTSIKELSDQLKQLSEENKKLSRQLLDANKHRKALVIITIVSIATSIIVIFFSINTILDVGL